MQSKNKIHNATPPLPLPDPFDQIPDSLVLLIFNKVADIRSLGYCAAVSKRFNSLVPHVDDVVFKIDRVDDDEDTTSSTRKTRSFLYLLKLMFGALFKPFHHLHSNNRNSKLQLPQLSHSSRVQGLKNFQHIHNLRIVLPTGDLGTEDGVIIKWKAEFGSTLQNCVILGGTQIDQKHAPTVDKELPEDNGNIPESFYTNGGLKLRVVWTISSLIAASARHYLLQQIVRDHTTLQSLILTDAEGQGTLSMGAEQLREFREKPLAASASSNRTQVPALNMKLRYAPYLELPGGMRMQGATLVAIRPSGEGISGAGGTRKEAEAFVCGAFDGPFKAAVKALVKRRTYLLEMNSF